MLGGNRLEERLAPYTALAVQERPTGTVVDVGGGTGRSRSLWPDAWSYVSIDPDERAVHFGQVGAGTERAVGDASDLPFPDGFADAVLLKDVSHHLDGERWEKTLSEVHRVLKSDGYLVFLDGVWSPGRWVSRLAWRLDVGMYPRKATEIENAIAVHFDVSAVERFSAIHDCVMMLARPRVKPSAPMIVGAMGN